MTTTHPTCETCKHWHPKKPEHHSPDLGFRVCTIINNLEWYEIEHLDQNATAYIEDFVGKPLMTKAHHYCAMHSEVCDG